MSSCMSLLMELFTDLLGINMGCTFDVVRLIRVGLTLVRVLKLFSSLRSLLRSNIKLLLSRESEKINWRASLAQLESSACKNMF